MTSSLFIMAVIRFWHLHDCERHAREDWGKCRNAFGEKRRDVFEKVAANVDLWYSEFVMT